MEPKYTVQDVIQYIDYVEERMPICPAEGVTVEKSRLYLELRTEFHEIFSKAHQELDGQDIAPLLERLAKCPIKSLWGFLENLVLEPRFIDVGTKTKLNAQKQKYFNDLAVLLQDNWQHFNSCPPSDSMDIDIYGASCSGYNLTQELWLLITRNLSLSVLIRLSQTNRHYYLLVWQLIQKYSFVSDSSLVGFSPAFMNALIQRTPNLSSLDLTKTNLPFDFTPFMANPLRLTTLKIGGCPLVFKSLCKSLHNFKSLRALALWSAFDPETIPYISSLANLIILDIPTVGRGLGLDPVAISSLAMLTRLKALRFTPRTPQVSHPAIYLPLHSLTCLEQLVLDRDGCDEIFQGLTPLMPSVKHLHLPSLHPRASPAVFNAFCTNIQLKSLHILCDSQDPTNYEFFKIDTLVHLRVRGFVKDPLIEKISALTRLETLDIQRFGMTDAAFPWLLRLTELKSLTIFDTIKETRITEDGLYLLTGLQKLEKLDIPQLTDNRTKELQNWQVLLPRVKEFQPPSKMTEGPFFTKPAEPGTHLSHSQT